jgi:hypothetical protein
MKNRFASFCILLVATVVFKVAHAAGGSCEQPVPADQAPLNGVAAASPDDIAATADVMPDDTVAAAEPGPDAEPVAQPVPSTRVGAAAPAPSAPKKQAPLSALQGWWPSPEAGKLNIERVEGGSYSSVIVIRTNGEFNGLQSVNEAVVVTNEAGQVVASDWSVAANRNTLLMPVPAGRYKVAIGAQFKDAKGLTVARATSGSVVVR